MDRITKSVVGKGEPAPDHAPMTDKTMREKTWQEMHDILVDQFDKETWNRGQYAAHSTNRILQEVKVAGVPLSELIEKAEEGVLVELVETQDDGSTYTVGDAMNSYEALVKPLASGESG